MVARNLIIGILASPELLAVLLVWALLVYFPEVFSQVGVGLANDSEAWKYITVLPTGLFVWSAKLFGEIRSPADRAENKRLYEWPHYRLLVARLYLAIFISGFSAAISIGLWLFGKSLESVAIGGVFIAALAVSVVVAATLTFARARIREILVHYG
jgi:hypothetical protein